MQGRWTVFVFLSLLVGCRGEKAPSITPTERPSAGMEAKPSLAGLVKVDGSSTVFPITEAVAEEFRRDHPQVNVTVGVSGTGGGFKKFARGEIDISDASRPIQAEEAEQCRQAGIEYIELPIAYDALTVVVNPKNTWCEAMTVEELKRLWEPEAQGKITKWSQIRPGWPDKEIKLLGPGVDSGTYDYFTEAIVGKEHASRGDFVPSEDDNVLVQGVSQDPYALAYFGYAYYEENRDRVKAVAIDNGSGPVAPSEETLRNGTYQPLSRPLFIYVNRAAADRSEVEAFVEFYLSQAKNLVREVGYFPLSEEAYQLALERFRKRVVGSVFGAKGSQVGVRLEDILRLEKGSTGP